jgi:hypothetical protein
MEMTLMKWCLLHNRAERTSAAKAVVGRPCVARLNPCPSWRDACSLSMFNARAPDKHFAQNAVYQGLKPILVQITTARPNRLRENADFEKQAALS